MTLYQFLEGKPSIQYALTLGRVRLKLKLQLATSLTLAFHAYTKNTPEYQNEQVIFAEPNVQ